LTATLLGKLKAWRPGLLGGKKTFLSKINGGRAGERDGATCLVGDSRSYTGLEKATNRSAQGTKPTSLVSARKRKNKPGGAREVRKLQKKDGMRKMVPGAEIFQKKQCCDKRWKENWGKRKMGRSIYEN